MSHVTRVPVFCAVFCIAADGKFEFLHCGTSHTVESRAEERGAKERPT